MKKVLYLLALVLFFAQCKDDEDDSDSANGGTTNPPVELTPKEEYLNNLEGVWQLSEVNYAFTIPDSLTGGVPLNIIGTSENESGSFVFEINPQTVDYEMDFEVTIAIPLIDPITVPVYFANEGTYSINEEATIMEIENEDQTSLELEILLDRANQQTYSGVIAFDIDGLGSTDIAVEMTIVR